MKDLLKNISEELKIDVIFYDYSGYGYSYPQATYEDENFLKEEIANGKFVQTIKPTEVTAYDDIESIYNHMIQNLKLDPKSIVVMGRSLGTGPSSYLAAHLSGKKN